MNLKLILLTAMALSLNTVAAMQEVNNKETNTPHPESSTIGASKIFDVLEDNSYSFGDKIMTLKNIKLIAPTPKALAETHNHTLKDYNISEEIFAKLDISEQWDIVLIMKAILSDPKSTRYFIPSEKAMNKKNELAEKYTGLIKL